MITIDTNRDDQGEEKLSLLTGHNRAPHGVNRLADDHKSTPCHRRYKAACLTAMRHGSSTGAQSKGTTMTTIIKRFVKNESGATAIEYGLIAAGISVAIVTVVKTVGSQLVTTFTSVQKGLG